MTIETELRTYTLADGNIAALVGARMHARKLPQAYTLPAIVYQRISTQRRHDMNGSDGLPAPYMQIGVWTTTPAEAATLAALIRQRLDGFRGTWGALSIGACRCVNELDADDPETGNVGVIQDYIIQFSEV